MLEVRNDTDGTCSFIPLNENKPVPDFLRGRKFGNKVDAWKFAALEALRLRAEDNKAYGCELMDPYGTIWEYAAALKKENERLKI